MITLIINNNNGSFRAVLRGKSGIVRIVQHTKDETNVPVAFLAFRDKIVQQHFLRLTRDVTQKHLRGRTKISGW